jgi:hypothetical protein
MTPRKKTLKKETTEDDGRPIIDGTMNPGLFDSSSSAGEPKFSYKQPQSNFIQFNVSNIYDCFSSGLIVPTVYVDERTTDDIQTRFSDSLLISNGYNDTFDKTQCLLEVVLKPTELMPFSGLDIFLYDKPIPITRIKRIIVFDQEVKKKIIYTALTQDVGNIPDNLFSYFDFAKYSEIDLNRLTTKKLNGGLFKNEIAIFDKLLGLFAFIKNQQLYYTPTTKVFSNYSEHFLDIFSIINSDIEAKYLNFIKSEFVKSFKKLFDYNSSDVSSPSSFIVNYLYNGGLIDNEFITNFFDLFSNTLPVKKEIITDLKNKLINPIGKKTALKPLFEISKSFYQVAYLYIYGKRGSNDKEILKNTIREELFFSQSEITLALIGMYYGYKHLRPSETLIFNDYDFEKLFGTEFNVKFNLSTKLDYFIIESLFEFVFNKKCGDNKVLAFDPIIREPLYILNDVKKNPDLEIEFDIEIYNTHYYKIKKQSEIDKITKLLSTFPEKIDSHFHLVAFIRKYYDKDLLILRGASGIVIKNELLNYISDGKLRISHYDHFLNCIELDKKYNLK